MADKRVYYYVASIVEAARGITVTDKMRDIFNNIFDKNSVSNNGIGTMTLHYKNEVISLDILINNESYLFARVGKAKDPTDAVIRDNATKECRYVLSGEELENKTLEICTYFLLDYKTGIVGFILGKSAPYVQSLISIVNEYDENYIMMINNIASPDSIRALMRPGAVINKIKYTFAIPSVDVLEEIGLDKEQIVALSDTDVQEVDLIIRNRPNKPLTKEESKVNNLITALARLPQTIKDTLAVTGRTNSSTAQSYSFGEQDIVYSVTVSTEKVEDGTRRKLTSDEVADEVFFKLRDVYIANRPHLLLFANLI